MTRRDATPRPPSESREQSSAPSLERRRERERERERAARAFINELRARTVCAVCGAQPIHWHNPDHRQQPRHRVGGLVRYSRARILAEIARCTPLCHPCHRRADGARAALDALAAARAARTHCPNGHPFDEANTRFERRGPYLVRRCRACRNADQRAWSARRRAERDR